MAEEVLGKAGMKDLKYMVGTMIEIPRAALTADEVAKEAEFFSFGTNDLTQTTHGPLARRLHEVPEGLREREDLRQRSVRRPRPGRRRQAGQDGRRERAARPRPDLEVGICGEHGGEPSSVQFCYRVGMNYVSCSPYRVPIARLAAAQAAISGDKSEAMRTA